ncbi:MAG: hypothetical protein A2493_00290 [Candidatus Magasanikbacteria bacterium RIFOXYC12_FULL_33_11]|uniref:Uncharacterized protein n=1 Tax=Candidatus Magasanikbacteria bacterium RIFOXYC12_FULL_33_11 TaxID=1798701 RepID=A0A1F6NPP5_9BACT|nr:MAG: hypothetical protein A2493_00290 [Candidatus Magasanikbacteria bacterium RIFOXYC12_FULL_33_11]
MVKARFREIAETTSGTTEHLLRDVDVATTFPGVADRVAPVHLPIVDEDTYTVERRRALRRVVVPRHRVIDVIGDPEVDLEPPDAEERLVKIRVERTRQVRALRVLLGPEVQVDLRGLRRRDHDLEGSFCLVLTVETIDAEGAVAGVLVHAVGAGPAVEARVGRAVVDVDLAVIADEPILTLAGVAVDAVGADATVEARVGRAVVDVDAGDAVADVAFLANAGVAADGVDAGRVDRASAVVGCALVDRHHLGVGRGHRVVRGLDGVGRRSTGLVGRAESAAGVEEEGQGHEVARVAHSFKPLCNAHHAGGQLGFPRLAPATEAGVGEDVTRHLWHGIQ